MKRRVYTWNPGKWPVSSCPRGRTSGVFFLSPFADLPVSLGSMVGRLGHLKQEHANKSMCFLRVVAQLGDAGLEDQGGSPLQALRDALYTQLDKEGWGGWGRMEQRQEEVGEGYRSQKDQEDGLSCHFHITTLCLLLMITIKKTPKFVKFHEFRTFPSSIKIENNIMHYLYGQPRV